MNDATKTAPAIRELALAETDAVSGGLGLSVRDQERIALQQRLSEALKSHQEDELAKKIEDRFHL
jgi:hypothetical protein